MFFHRWREKKRSRRIIAVAPNFIAALSVNSHRPSLHAASTFSEFSFLFSLIALFHASSNVSPGLPIWSMHAITRVVRGFLVAISFMARTAIPFFGKFRITCPTRAVNLMAQRSRKNPGREGTMDGRDLTAGRKNRQRARTVHQQIVVQCGWNTWSSSTDRRTVQVKYLKFTNRSSYRASEMLKIHQQIIVTREWNA